jgi:hypothetical protein
MPSVLICATDPLIDELHATPLWREDVERRVANRLEDALTAAVASRPDLIAVASDLPRADRLIMDLRADAKTRTCSIVVISRGEFDPEELHLLEAGANSILRLPAGPEWEERLGLLMNVPARRQARVPVRLEVEVRPQAGIEVVWGTVINLSISGMLVEANERLQLGADVDFSFRLEESESDLEIVGSGQIVRRAGAARFGIRFYGLEGDAAHLIAAFVSAG